MMIDKIIKSLELNNIKEFLITEEKTESVELFFIKKELDMNRKKNVTKYDVTVYREFEKDGERMKGSSTVKIYPTMDEYEIEESLKDAYFAAGFVCNKYYELPHGEEKEFKEVQCKIKEVGLEEASLGFTEGLFLSDNLEKGWVNSAEIFVEKKEKRIVNSNGIDVSFEGYAGKGEYIAQWVENNDVESYDDFVFSDLDKEELNRKVKETLQITKERDKATTVPKSGDYKCIISGMGVSEIASYYSRKCDVSVIYQKFSDFKAGDEIQGQDVIGDKVSIDLVGTVPYNREGVEVVERSLIENGEIKTLYGPSRFAQYLEVEAAPDCEYIVMKGGSKSFSEMKTLDYIHVLSFSGFQVDLLTGDFAGEIRLGFVKCGDEVTPVTGGSISGSLLSCQKEMNFSKEMQKVRHVECPLAVEFARVRVAGE